MSKMRDLLGKLAQIDEAANPAQQAAIAINMKRHHKKPKSEGTMADAEQHSTGPKFPGYWKGTDPVSKAKDKMVGGGVEESLLHDLERALVENPKANPHQLMREFQEFKQQDISEGFGSNNDAKLAILNKIIRAAGHLTAENAYAYKQIIQSHAQELVRMLSPQAKQGIEVIEQAMQEDAAPNAGTTANTNQTNPNQTAQVDPKIAQQQKQEQQTLTKNLNKLKAAGINVNTNQAQTAFNKADAGAKLNPTEKDNVTKFAPAVGDIMADPSLASQFTTLVQKAKQQELKQQKVQPQANNITPQQTQNTNQQGANGTSPTGQVK